MSEARGARVVAATPRQLRPLAEVLVPRARVIAQWFRTIHHFGLAALLPWHANAVRESHAVREGIRRFHSADETGGDCDYTLRRNIHRIEKGLIGRPRRPVFAADYIEQTVDHYVARAQRAPDRSSSQGELEWARDVLRAYFDAVTSTPEIDRARNRFLGLGPATTESQPRLVPYHRDLGESPVSTSALLQLSVRRRSIRWFDGRRVPRESIDAAMLIAAQAPSACNRQPFEFRIYEDAHRVRRIVDIPGGASGFTEDLPCVVAVIGDLGAFYSDRDRHLIYIDASLAAMSFMLGLETLGLSSCALNTPGDETVERRLCLELGLRPYERPIMLIALGYPNPAGLVPRSEKKPLNQLRRYFP